MSLAEYEANMEYAGVILLDAELGDIAHFFEYIADDVAEALLG
jgi:hypothetical protein